MARAVHAEALAEKVLSQLRERRVLLQADAVLPSGASIVAGESIRGSWWSHAKSNEIYWTLETLEDSTEVLQVKLVQGKLTLVHRALWPALLAVATSGDSWQTAQLSEPARKLLSRVRRNGLLRLDRLTRWSATKKPGEAARELELRLLALTRGLHTESGGHTKEVESWSHFSERLGPMQLPAVAEAREEIERFVPEGAAGLLPWRRRRR